MLAANAGPANNGGSPGWAMFLNLIAGTSYVQITGMTTASSAAANASFTIEFFTLSGNALGGPVGSGPGSSMDGWTSLGTVPVTQGSTASGVSLLFATPSIIIAPGDTTGVAMLFTVAGPRYYGTGAPPYEVYSDAFLTLVTGDARSAPFTPSDSFFTSRALVGEIHYDDIVPVELASFTSQVNENDVVLNWTTAIEVNNSGFQIERKTSETDWTNAGFVNGHGTTTEVQVYSFTDRDLEPGLYSYRLKQIDLGGTYKYYELAETVELGILEDFYLSQNYPNPFNPTTVISWYIPTNNHVTLKVYNLLGKEVATLVNEEKQAGTYEVNFDASSLSSGTYFYTLQAGDFVQTNKMILIK